MGTWNVSITGNDTAHDLVIEYTAAFYKYDVEEALNRIDQYIREEMDESDEEEWCNYMYSLADFMWKKGILTESVQHTVIEMIDSGFGLELWAEAGKKTFDDRKKKLDEFRTKILSPQPAPKKIKPNVHTERIFEDGDIIAVQLQTANKPYTEHNKRPLSEEEFRSLDGKYVLMQLLNCSAQWSSSIVPEVKDYWANFRLFDGIYDEIPDHIDVSLLKDAMLHQGTKISPVFTCESNMFYFKKRKYKLICNRKDLCVPLTGRGNNSIFWGINRPWTNPDSQLVSAMNLQTVCSEYSGSLDTIQAICESANRYGRFNYQLSREANEARYKSEEENILNEIQSVLSNDGKLYVLSFSREIGIVTWGNSQIGNLYIEGQYQKNGFGSQLLDFIFSLAGNDAYIDVPESNIVMQHVCEKIGLIRLSDDDGTIRMGKP